MNIKPLDNGVRIKTLTKDDVADIKKLNEANNWTHVWDKFGDSPANPNTDVQYLGIYNFSNDLIGYVAYSSIEDSTGMIHLILVDKGYRNDGVAEFLIDSVEVNMIENGMARSSLLVRESNKEAIDNYYKQGYFQNDRIDGYYDDGENAFLMVKELDKKEKPKRSRKCSRKRKAKEQYAEDKTSALSIEKRSVSV